jgi:hypothetical protein
MDKHFTPAPGAATTATAATAEAAPTTTTAAAATAAYTTPAVLTPLTARTPLTSLAPLTPLTSRALAHIPTTATAAGSDRSNRSALSDWSDRSNLSNLSALSDRYGSKRPETLILEHPRPGPGAGSGVGSRKAAPRSLESLDRYEEAPITATKTSPGKIINETVSTHPGKTQVFSPPEVDLHRLTDQVYLMLEKKIKTERERRGW